MGSGILTGAGVVLALAVLGSQAAVVAGAAAAVARQKERAAPTVAATPPVKVEICCAVTRLGVVFVWEGVRERERERERRMAVERNDLDDFAPVGAPLLLIFSPLRRGERLANCRGRQPHLRHRESPRCWSEAQWGVYASETRASAKRQFYVFLTYVHASAPRFAHASSSSSSSSSPPLLVSLLLLLLVLNLSYLLISALFSLLRTSYSFRTLFRQGTWRKTSASSSRSSSSLSQRKQRDAKRSASDSPAPSRTRPPTTFEHLLAGTVGGVSGALVSYPLDTVRVRWG